MHVYVATCRLGILILLDDRLGGGVGGIFNDESKCYSMKPCTSASSANQDMLTQKAEPLRCMHSLENIRDGKL